MQRASVVTLMILLGCGAAAAQSATTLPGMGVTSPLGILGSNSSAGGTGVPLGATEIDPGGLSPATSCVPADPSILGSTSTTTGIAGTSTSTSTSSGSTFDGGGVGSFASNCTSVTPNTPNVTTTGIASPLSGASTNLAGGTIPLGATALDSGGLSPMIAVPAPVIPTPDTTTGCTGSTMIGSDPTAMSLGTTFGSVPGC